MCSIGYLTRYHKPVLHVGSVIRTPAEPTTDAQDNSYVILDMNQAQLEVSRLAVTAISIRRCAIESR